MEWSHDKSPNAFLLLLTPRSTLQLQLKPCSPQSLMHKCIGAFARAHVDTGTCAHSHQGVQRSDMCFKYYLVPLTPKDNSPADLKVLKRKGGPERLQRSFLRRFNNTHSDILTANSCHRWVAANYCPDWGGDNCLLDLQRGGGLWGAQSTSLCFPSIPSELAVCEWGGKAYGWLKSHPDRLLKS